MSVGANRRADRRNRGVLTVLGLTLTGAGITALVLGLVSSTRDDAVITSGLARFGNDGKPWLWAGALVVALVALALALWWLFLQLRPLEPVEAITLSEPDTPPVRVQADSLLDQIAADLQEGPGVRSARGRLTSSNPLEAVIELRIEDRTPPSELARFADHYVRRRAEHAIGRPVDLTLELVLEAPAPPARVS